MRRFRWSVVALVVFAAGVRAGRAADHLDGPTASGEPQADITDVYAWMSADTTKVNLVMDVSPNAPPGAGFSDQVQYVFHVNSMPSFGAFAIETVILCQFDAAQIIQCWVTGGEYLTGDASVVTGLASGSGSVRVFAGLRNDPFFFNLDGFNATRTMVSEAAAGLTFDEANCPNVNNPTSAAVVAQLREAPGGGAATNFFVTHNVLSLVVEIDTELVNPGGSLLGVWASTNQRQ